VLSVDRGSDRPSIELRNIYSRVLTQLGDGEGNMATSVIPRTGKASSLLTLRSHRPCACRDAFYAELGRSKQFVYTVNKFIGKPLAKPINITVWKSDRLIVVKKLANKLLEIVRRSEWSEGA
jgi:hypothetical protein